MPERFKRPSRAPLATPNIVPLLDVLLVLVAVLMLMTPFLTRQLPVEVPAVGVSGIPIITNTVSVVLKEDAEGFLVGDAFLSEEELLSRVGPQTSVEILADSSIQYGEVARLLALLRAQGPRNIYLAVQ